MKILSKIPTIIIVGIIAYIVIGSFLSSLLVNPYKPEKFEVYEQVIDKQINRIFLSPKGHLIYSKNLPQFENCFDIALFRIKGEKCTNLIGGLWNVDKDGSPLGLRYDSKAASVWNLRLELTNKIYNNMDESSFDAIGEKFEDRLYVYENQIEIGAGKFKKIEMKPEEISNVFQFISESKQGKVIR